MVDKKFPWIGGIPDGLIKTPNEGEGILEIKCPYKGKDMKISEMIANFKTFYLYYVKKGEIGLKKSNDYYYQVQGYMFITKTKWCDFVVWTKTDISISRIQFDNKFFAEKMFPQLEHFYLKQKHKKRELLSKKETSTTCE